MCCVNASGVSISGVSVSGIHVSGVSVSIGASNSVSASVSRYERTTTKYCKF
jgi:hypothetical protein